MYLNICNISDVLMPILLVFRASSFWLPSCVVRLFAQAFFIFGEFKGVTYRQNWQSGTPGPVRSAGAADSAPAVARGPAAHCLRPSIEKTAVFCID